MTVLLDGDRERRWREKKKRPAELAGLGSLSGAERREGLGTLPYCSQRLVDWDRCGAIFAAAAAAAYGP